MKVLVFAEYGWRNGGENSFLSIAKILIRQNVSFLVACPAPSELSEKLEQIGIGVIPWSLKNDSGIRKSQTEIRREIDQIIRDANPDIVHCNSLSTARLSGPVTARLRVPAVGFLRDIIKVSRQAMVDINQLTHLIAVSNATRKFHLNQGLSEPHSSVLYNGVDLNQFAPGSQGNWLHDELGIDHANRLIVCIGQIGIRKGTDIVIRSFFKLAEIYDDLELLIIGIRNSFKSEAVEFEDHCRKIVEESQHSRRVHWLGRRTDVARIMSESTLLLHAARQEPLGRVLLESLATGLPFIATDVGGTREIVSGTDLESMLCDSSDSKLMFSNASVCLESKELLSSLARQCRQQAEKVFDVQHAATSVKSIYQQVNDG